MSNSVSKKRLILTEESGRRWFLIQEFLLAFGVPDGDALEGMILGGWVEVWEYLDGVLVYAPTRKYLEKLDNTMGIVAHRVELDGMRVFTREQAKAYYCLHTDMELTRAVRKGALVRMKVEGATFYAGA